MQPFTVQKPNRKPFADRIDWLVRQRTNASDFARTIGVSESVVRKWRSGASEPGREHLEAIARQTGVSAAWLLLGEGEPDGSAYPAAPPVQPAAMQAREAPARAGFPAHVVEAAVEALETALQTLRIPMPPDKRAQAVVMLCRLAELMSADEMRRELREVAQQVARLAA